ncbi:MULTISPECIES: ABC transporter ATP-binding protein [unclassified Frankia]|uniref:ABC transporter ATP-binding protein n=1 Tax=unclassified Frankia TaxID=2632575 RepID=UPI000AFBAA20|nr:MULTISPECIES: ABC transporter ATP-binding protein [unclassified Frankia]
MLLRNIAFRYGRRAPVVEGLDLALDERPLVMIGPNGAGKSTVLRLMAGQLRPRSGRIEYAGKIGFAPQFTPVLPNFTVEQQVRYAGWLSGLSRREAARSAGPALARANLEALARRPARQTSGGERARLGIACALATDPDLLLLDEPTASLDPLARESVSEVLTELAGAGTRLVVTSHTATEVRPPFERLIVLDHGVVRFDGSLGEFFDNAHDDRVVAAFAQALRVH